MRFSQAMLWLKGLILAGPLATYKIWKAMRDYNRQTGKNVYLTDVHQE